MPRHDHPTVDRRPFWRRDSARRDAAPGAGHGQPLAVGSNIFPTRAYENPPDLVNWLAAEIVTQGVKPEVEAFDLSHILKAQDMWRNGQIAALPYVQFVMGVKNAMPADRDAFDYSIHTIHRLSGPDAPWCAAGIGPAQLTLNEWSVSSGGHARTGLEDNVRLDKDTLAPSNAALVRRVTDLCAEDNRPVAPPRASPRPSGPEAGLMPASRAASALDGPLFNAPETAALAARMPRPAAAAAKPWAARARAGRSDQARTFAHLAPRAERRKEDAVKTG